MRDELAARMAEQMKQRKGVYDALIDDPKISVGSASQRGAVASDTPEPNGIPFKEQLARILDVLDDEEHLAFLAGVRFAQGFAEYGDAVWHKTSAQLKQDILEERADAYIYELVELCNG